MVRVLIAEDSLTTRELLRALFFETADLTVVGEAHDGLAAIALTKVQRPDVIVMDIHMPRMDGFEATRQIMIEAPTPIVIMSASVDVRAVETSMHALRAGALVAIPKPVGPGATQFEAESARFLETVRAMSQVKVVRRWPDRRQPRVTPPAPYTGAPRVELVAIAASTGGPAAIHQILSELPATFPPVLVVQHMASGFIDGFASWLNTAGQLRVRVAQDGELLAPGTAYVAPDDRHLGISSATRIALADADPIGSFRPSATHLFREVARHHGRAAIAVILTGMGDDGCTGLEAVRRAGGRVIAQDEKTSVVFGMPAAAIAARLADWTLPLAEIGQTLKSLAGR